MVVWSALVMSADFGMLHPRGHVLLGWEQISAKQVMLLLLLLLLLLPAQDQASVVESLGVPRRPGWALCCEGGLHL